mmetsp:Transcript_36767/g.97146  ORF Transcript_36767/g.97146 Transcript_36767/m.97146 type:complete len:566 (+) Transcript_36767:100-1797(+)
MGIFDYLGSQVSRFVSFSGYSRLDEDRARNLLSNWLSKESTAARRIQRWQRRHMEVRATKAATLFASRFRAYMIRAQFRRRKVEQVPTFRRWLVPLICDPSSSSLALALEILWCALAVLAVLVDVLGTFSAFLGPDGTAGGCPLPDGAEHWMLQMVDDGVGDGMEAAVLPCSVGLEGCTGCPTVGSEWFEIAQTVCALGFTAEFSLRVLTCDSGRWLAYVTELTSLLRVATFVPWYAQLALGQDPREGNTLWLRAFDLFRILRLIGLFSQSVVRKQPDASGNAVQQATGYSDHRMLATFSKTIYTTAPSILISAFISLLLATVFGSLLFFVEHGEWDEEQKLWLRADGKPTPFTSIPAAMYYYLVSLTTCGYGDMSPISAGGRAIAGSGILVGLLALAAPIATLSANFAAFERLSAEYDSQDEEGRRARDAGQVKEAVESELRLNSADVPDDDEDDSDDYSDDEQGGKEMRAHHKAAVKLMGRTRSTEGDAPVDLPRRTSSERASDDAADSGRSSRGSGSGAEERVSKRGPSSHGSQIAHGGAQGSAGHEGGDEARPANRKRTRS